MYYPALRLIRVQNDAVYLRQTDEARFDIVFCCLQVSSKLEATRAPPSCQQLLNDGRVGFTDGLIGWLQFRATHSFPLHYACSTL